MNYEEMNNHQINKRVARAIGVEWIAVAEDGLIVDGKSASVDYCNNPEDAWPVIVDNKISIEADEFMSDIFHELVESGTWTASPTGASGINVYHCDKNPLRAAMICFLKMKDAENE